MMAHASILLSADVVETPNAQLMPLVIVRDHDFLRQLAIYPQRHGGQLLFECWIPFTRISSEIIRPELEPFVWVWPAHLDIPPIPRPGEQRGGQCAVGNPHRRKKIFDLEFRHTRIMRNVPRLQVLVGVR